MIVKNDIPGWRLEKHLIEGKAGLTWGLLLPKAICCVAMAVLAFMLLSHQNPRIAQAQSTGPKTSDVFIVSNIHVDKTAANATVARKEALTEGEQIAFDTLLRRLTLHRDYQRLPHFKDEETSGYIRDFGVTNEKNSPVRYLADLTYRFKSNEIRGLLRDYEIPFAETPSKPVLLLPVYQVAGAMSLWDEPNPWRAAWNKRLKLDGLVPLIFAKGDLTDISLIGAELAVKGDKQRLLAIAKRYGVATVMVAQGDLVSTAKGLPGLRISVDHYSQGSSTRTLNFDLISIAGEGIDDLLLRGATDVALRIEDQWKSDNILQFEQVAVLAATLPIGNLKDWVEAKQRLSKVAVISRTDLVLLSRNEVRLNVHYIGDPNQLTLALAQADIMLVEKEGNWVLRLHQAQNSETRK